MFETTTQMSFHSLFLCETSCSGIKLWGDSHFYLRLNVVFWTRNARTHENPSWQTNQEYLYYMQFAKQLFWSIYIYIKLASKTNSLNTNTVPTPITHHQIIDFEQVLCTLSCCSWNPSCANELLAMWTRETWTCAVAPEDLNSACHGKDIKLWLVG